jgi:hypothetical protein
MSVKIIEDESGEIHESKGISWWYFILAAIVAFGGWYILTQIKF